MTPLRLTALALAAAVAAVAPSAAQAKGTDVRVKGSCTKSSAAKLKLSPENGRLEIEFEVDQNRNGVPWKVTIRRGGAVVLSRTYTTRAPSGSFTARKVAGGSGAVRATATRAGESCSAQASI